MQSASAQQMKMLDHERLVVYQPAIEIVVFIDELIERFPKGRAYLCDQLQRAGTSIALNIAEGAGEYSKNEKARFYRIAKRSATECASILDVCLSLKLIEESHYTQGRTILMNIINLLTKMVHTVESRVV